MSDTVKISLVLADKGAQKQLEELIKSGGVAAKGMKQLKDEGKKAFDEITVGIGKSIGVYDIFVGNLAANLALAGFGALKDAASALFNTFITDGVKASIVQEEAINSLAVAMATAGEYSKDALDDFKEFASGIQSVSTVGDEAVLSQLALAKAYGANNEQAKEVVKAAVELSAAMGINLDAATQRVSKTLGGLAGELGEVNPAIKALTKEQLKAGDAAKILIEQYSGSATGKIATFSGAVTQASNSFGDLQETIGSMITGNPAVIAAINEISRIIGDSTDAISGNNSEYKRLISEGFIGLIDSSRLVVQSLGVLGTAGSVAINGLATSVNGLNSLVYTALSALSGFNGRFEELRIQFTKAADESRKALDASSDPGVFDRLDAALASISQKSTEAFNAMATGADSTVEPVNRSKQAVIELSAEQQKLLDANTKYTEQLASQDDAAIYELKLEQVRSFYEQQGIVQAEAEELEFASKLEREQNYITAQQELLNAKYAEDEARVNSSLASQTQKDAALLALKSKFNTETLKLETDLAKKVTKLKEEEQRRQDLVNKQTLASTAGLFGALGDLASQGGREAFEASKALNAAQAITSGILAVQNALTLPYPANIVAAAAMGITTAANVNRIINTPTPQFADGGIVPGSSFSGDRIVSRLNSGEMVLNRSQQAELFNVANGGGTGDGASAIVSRLDRLEQAIRQHPTLISIDGSAVFSAVRTEMDRGRTL